jgi:two-component system, chemotaxis family, chemotaxis protein CheY
MTSQINLATVRVLVVDDEDFYRSLIVRLLDQIGFKEIDEAVDGAHAVTKLASFKPDLIVLDIMMVPMNGLKFLKMLRIGMTEAPSDLPVIVLTGSEDGAHMGTALALDCDAFAKKDDDHNIIKERILRVVSTPRTMKATEVYGAITLPKSGMPTPPPLSTRDKSLSSSNPVEVPVYELQPGSVLDHDLVSEEGYILYAGETTLLEADIARLQDLSGIIGLDAVFVRPS